ncbi:hypothetical protein [Rariglobus hedericola]|uniref:Uncharacterized protein n=1 Tax=Rariglobus hedericola TaxID=2597822 RepID=A0A556QRA8_9BACT|nr:hypothetical protein [Rariglobus hedericola]TSJ79176.1 hypothetical protein FPL22_07740 [Rariglobus hedericola]
MSLTPEQSAAVSTWVASGDNLSVIQKKLREEFQVAMTYMDVRFLVDDLNLQLKDAPAKVDTSDVSKTQPKAAPAGAATPSSPSDQPPGEDDLADEAALPGGSVILDVDGVTLIPGAIASGKVTFSDGVTGKWIIDNQGRPGFTEISQPGYRPTPEDAKSFMNQLEAELQRRGL